MYFFKKKVFLKELKVTSLLALWSVTVWWRVGLILCLGCKIWHKALSVRNFLWANKFQGSFFLWPRCDWLDFYFKFFKLQDVLRGGEQTGLRYYGQLAYPPPPHPHPPWKKWVILAKNFEPFTPAPVQPLDSSILDQTGHNRQPPDTSKAPETSPTHFSNIPRKLSVEHWVESITPSLGPLQRIRIRDMTKISQLDHFILDRQATEGSIRSFVWRCARSLKSGKGAISQQAHFIPMVVQSSKYELWFTISCWSFCLFDPTIN